MSVGKDLNFSLVNIAGNDILQGNKKLIICKTAQLRTLNMISVFIQNVKTLFHPLVIGSLKCSL